MRRYVFLQNSGKNLDIWDKHSQDDSNIERSVCVCVCLQNFDLEWFVTIAISSKLLIKRII